MVWNRQFLRDGKASHSPCIWMSARHGVAAAENFGQREGVAAVKKIGQREGVAATKKFSQRERRCLKTTYL